MSSMEGKSDQLADIPADSPDLSVDNFGNKNDIESRSKDASSNPEEAKAILQQVEYYFSDENLLKDDFLYHRMNGSKHKPVPVSLVHSFNKMKDFQPYSFVLDSIRQSQKLDIVTYKEKDCILRKIPFSRHDHPGAAPWKTTTKPTGFEEHYTEVITPQIFKEEREMYDPEYNSFADRIEIAIQRYKAKRRFSNQANDIWGKFMRFGGISSGPRQFTGGLSKEELDDMSATEIAQAMATDFVGNDKYDLGDEYDWTVDFSGVAKGFLLVTITPMHLELANRNTRSSFINDHFAFSSQNDVTQCTNILRNFYNYLLHHNVCPEYADDILAARKICDVANVQLLSCLKACQSFPGDFNKACSILFGGRYQGLVADASESEHQDKWGGLSLQQARQIFAVAAVTCFSNEKSGRESGESSSKTRFDQKITISERAGFEITTIINPDVAVRAVYADELNGSLTAVGKLYCKPWEQATFEVFDRPLGVLKNTRQESYEFVVEENVLDHCFIGMKFQADICTTNTGLQFIDRFETAFPSYHTVLLNGLMSSSDWKRKWKEPKAISRE